MDGCGLVGSCSAGPCLGASVVLGCSVDSNLTLLGVIDLIVLDVIPHAFRLACW